MNDLIRASRVVANDLRRAESSIYAAMRETAQFLLTTLDVTDTHKLPAAVAQKTVTATIDALSSLAEGQERMAMRAHLHVERAGRHLGLDETAWGESLPKPSIQMDAPAEAITA